MDAIKTAKVWIGERKGITSPLHVSQYDTGWTFEFTVYKDDVIYTTENTVTVVFEGLKSDGTTFAAPGTFADGVVTVETTVAMTSAAGIVECELRLSEGGETVGTGNFDMVVEPSPIEEGTPSESDYTTLQTMVDEVSELYGETVDAAAAAESAAASAEAEVLEEVPDLVWDWLEANVTPETGYVIDRSLTVQGAAADAKAVGDMRLSVYNDIFNTAPNSDLWERGSVNAASGEDYNPATTSSYCRTGILTADIKAVTPYSGIKVAIYGWDGDTFQGVWTSNGWEKASTNRLWLQTPIVFTQLPTSNRYRLVAAYVDGSAIDTAAQVTAASALVGLCHTTDTTMTTAGIAADAKAVGERLETLKEASSEIIDTSGFTFWPGGINSEGYQNTTNNTRLRVNNEQKKSGFFVNAGSTISVADGYKFNCAQYDVYRNNNDFHLIALRSLAGGSFTIPQDCYIKVTIGTLNNDILWTEDEDGVRTLTQEGIAATESITFNLYGGTAMEKIGQLENAVSQAVADAVQPLRHAMPINAVDYHALWDEMVNEGFCERSEPEYVSNDQRWPLYTYTIKAHKDWFDAGYNVVPYNGSNELYSRPKVLIVSGIHGSERGTPNFLLDFLKNTMRGNSEYADLLVKFDWTIVPLANPWGYSHSFVKSNGTVYYGQEWFDPGNVDGWELQENEAVHGYAGGTRRTEGGYDINRDFSDVTYILKNAYPGGRDGADGKTYGFVRQESQYLKEVLQSEDFDLVIDLHQSNNQKSCGFISFAGKVFDDEDSAQYRASKYQTVVQAGAATDIAMCAKYDKNYTQTTHPWEGIISCTFKNYAAGKKTMGNSRSTLDYYIGNINHQELAKDCVPVLETSTVCTPYSGIKNTNMTGWYNTYALDFGNTFLRNYLRRYLEEA